MEINWGSFLITAFLLLPLVVVVLTQEPQCDSDQFCSLPTHASMALTKSALILGSTGETGRELLSQMVKTATFGRIVTVGRRVVPLPEEEGYDRVEQKVVDFDNIEKHEADFANVDTAFCCLGTTRGKAGKEGFIKVDHDYVLNAAQILQKSGCPDFHLLTSKGSNADGWFLYTSTKGKVENAVKNLGFPRLSIYRPGVLMCDRQESRTGEALIRWLAGFIDRSHSWSIPTSMVAAAMLNNSLSNSKEPVTILEHHEVLNLAKGTS